MSMIRCDAVTDGLRDSEALVQFHDFNGRQHYLRVERDFLVEIGRETYLPIGVVRIDPRSGRVLVELSHEAETGANRLWVEQDQLDARREAYA